MDILLEVKNITVGFEKNSNILENISFEVKKGELISLIGLNGSGKTTLLKTIVGLIKPKNGSIKRHTKNIFYIPQKIDLDTSFPLNVREFCQLFGTEDYEKYLEAVGMQKFLNSKVSTLSGGEYQRVLLAISLSQKPDLMLLDEPVAGIDISGEQSFYKLITDLKKEYDVSIILVSHNINLVVKNTDKVICLAHNICCSGSTKKVKESPEFKEIFGKYLEPYHHGHENHNNH